jgi:hypothetical protein
MPNRWQIAVFVTVGGRGPLSRRSPVGEGLHPFDDLGNGGL